MGSSYSTWMRFIDGWQWGAVRLAVFEINPKSGPPDCVIDVTDSGEAGIMGFPPLDNWEACPRKDSEFVLFLTNPRGDILLDGIYSRFESTIFEHAERCRRVFESLAPGR